MTLKTYGFRFCVKADRNESKWIHPLEVIDGWIDCTDMTDEEFINFMQYVV